MLERAGTRSPLSIPTVDEIRDRACAFAFGKAVVENSNRGLVAEIIVEAAIGPEWELCSGDWGGWDFEYVSDRARRFEVRQSAALQTWLPSKKPKHPRFDIRVKKGYYKGAEWIPHPGRHAQIYVFAYHAERDRVVADHRDVSYANVISLCEAVPWTGLRNAVERARDGL